MALGPIKNELRTCGGRNLQRVGGKIDVEPNLRELRGVKEKTHQKNNKLSLHRPSSAKISLNNKENILNS